jgi:predicted nuclease of predicted toxin-antitoxin system
VKLLLDQHFSRKLVPHLQTAFPGTSHVLLHQLDEQPDSAVWDVARRNGFVILSKDEDFQLLSFSRGHPPKVIWFRSGNGPTSQVLITLLTHREAINAFINDEDRSLLELA